MMLAIPSLQTIETSTFTLVWTLVLGIVLALVNINIRHWATAKGHDVYLLKLWNSLPEWGRKLLAGWSPLRQLWWLWLSLGLSGGLGVALWLLAPAQMPDSTSAAAADIMKATEPIRLELENTKKALSLAQQAQRAPPPPPVPPVSPAEYRNKMSAQKTIETVRLLSGVFLQNPHATMVITAPPESEAFKNDFYAMIVAACQREPTADCTIEPAPNPQLDIDSGITDPEYQGIVIHHKSIAAGDYTADIFISALSCYVVRKTSHLPDGIAHLNLNNTPYFYWFELGHGSPWQSDNTSRCG